MLQLTKPLLGGGGRRWLGKYSGAIRHIALCLLRFWCRVQRAKPRTPTSWRAGGCTFPSDPSENYARAAPIWSAALDPHVIRVRAIPCGPGERLGLRIERFDLHIVVAPHAEHVLLRAKDASLRLDIIEGTLLDGPVILEPSVKLEELDRQIAAIRKLHAFLRGMVPPKEVDSRLPRLLLALRVLDARARGASLRDLAFGILGGQDWPGDGDSMKSRVRRLVELSEGLRCVGARGILAHRV